ncbi:hypothetical protein EST38_g11715 [Candolleomyces aberdarensis]|uniref:NACHT domain-containing protein n=1 Tax=Candolleomyces aberdarensis TaxID=2316362 RepID=A0A4V1Q278_9AGAR|nr:hypothetical protein EST38_g11715 [Candolleomyces aberdarensis]
MAPSAAFFSDASHFTIQGSQFTATQTTSIQSLAVDPALEILHKHQALEATHTSKTAANAAKCKPGTRAEAIKDITRWAAARQIEAARQAEDDRRVDAACQVEADLQVEVEPSSKSSVESVLWLRGPAGAGKTCIMREVARICRQEGVLAGDYFFSTRVPGLDDEAPFVATIVSHLITVIPALDNPIRETIRCNPTIFKQALDLQVEELISNHTAIIPPQTPRILVVDGFDECRDQSQRKHLLDLLHSLVTPPHFFRVVMASRPEYDIRTAFDQPPLESMTKILHLEKYEASGEIYEFLSEGFARIRKTHPARESIPAEWPGQATLHALTDKSSGIFAYPSTVIKYIDNPRHHPVDLLDHVLKPPPAVSSGHPFTELDALYEIILNPPDTDIPRMKRILHLIMMIPRLLGTVPAGSSPSHRSKFSFMPDFIDPYQMTNTLLSAPQLDGFLSLRRGTTEMTLCDLHSVLSVTEPIPPSPCFHNEGYETMYSPGRGPWIYFHHKTLEDYLCSPQRAGNLYQAQDDTCSDILAVCVHNMELWDRESRSGYVDYRKKIVKITLIFSGPGF